MQISRDSGGTASVADSFPELDALVVRLSLESKDWTIWPGPPETRRDFMLGFPLELHPFAWDYLVVSCNRARVELKPHYLESSFDSFWVDTRGHVTCHALGELFPFTLGRQPELLEGLRTTLKAVARQVAPSDPVAARTIEVIAEQLGAIGIELGKISPEELLREIEHAWKKARATRRGRAAEAFWLAKRERSRRRRRP